MDDLIRKQTVLNIINDVRFGNITHKLSQLHEAVRNYPSVDAVEVVRCKDCIHYKGMAECECVLESGGTMWFCAWGERKSDVQS